MAGQETAEVPILLLTITHPDLAEPMRFSSDATQRDSDTPLVYKTVSRGDDYYFVPMQATLPDDREDGVPEAQLRLSNVGRDLIEVLRSTSWPATVTMELVLASDPDGVEIEWPDFDLSSIDYDASEITLHLTIDALASEEFPAGAFTPGYFPGLF